MQKYSIEPMGNNIKEETKETRETRETKECFKCGKQLELNEDIICNECIRKIYKSKRMNKNIEPYNLLISRESGMTKLEFMDMVLKGLGIIMIIMIGVLVFWVDNHYNNYKDLNININNQQIEYSSYSKDSKYNIGDKIYVRGVVIICNSVGDKYNIEMSGYNFIIKAIDINIHDIGDYIKVYGKIVEFDKGGVDEDIIPIIQVDRTEDIKWK